MTEALAASDGEPPVRVAMATTLFDGDVRQHTSRPGRAGAPATLRVQRASPTGRPASAAETRADRSYLAETTRTVAPSGVTSLRTVTPEVAAVRGSSRRLTWAEAS